MWKKREDFAEEMEGPSSKEREEVKRKIGRRARESASREMQEGIAS